MITRLSVSRYRSLRSVTLELGSLNIITGAVNLVYTAPSGSRLTLPKGRSRNLWQRKGDFSRPSGQDQKASREK